jgi:hypothetical protein
MWRTVVVGLAGESEDEIPLHADAVLDQAAGHAFGHLGVDTLVHRLEDAIAAGLDTESDFA